MNPTGLPHCQQGTWPASIAPTRFASKVRRGSGNPGGVGLLGLPDDLGVRLNHGRPGACEGPTALRTALARYGVADPPGFDWPEFHDLGDVPPAQGADAAALEDTHRRVTEATSATLEHGLFPIAVGGGHDLTFAFARGVLEHHRRAGRTIDAVVYFDAHLDVREEPGSGMPFRRLVEECRVRRLHLGGWCPYANSREHVDWFQSHGGVLMAGGAFDVPPGPYVASFDLDVLDAAHAPGVSAMNPAGWSVKEAAEVVRRLGADPNCLSFDIMELSPPNDPSGRTARAAAHLLLSFLDGYAARGVR